MTLAAQAIAAVPPAQALSSAAYPGPMVALRLLRDIRWLSPMQVLIMVALIVRVDNATGETPAWCSPSIATLADDVHVGISTVQRALRALEARGLVAITRRWAVARNGHRHRITSLYRVVLPGYEDAARAPAPRNPEARAPDRPPERPPRPSLPDRPQPAMMPMAPSAPKRQDTEAGIQSTHLGQQVDAPALEPAAPTPALTVDDMAEHMRSVLYRHQFSERSLAVRDALCAGGFLTSLAYQALVQRLTPEEVRSAIVSFDCKVMLSAPMCDVPELRRDLRRYLLAERRIEAVRVEGAVRRARFDLACRREKGERLRWVSEDELREIGRMAS